MTSRRKNILVCETSGRCRPSGIRGGGALKVGTSGTFEMTKSAMSGVSTTTTSEMLLRTKLASARPKISSENITMPGRGDQPGDDVLLTGRLNHRAGVVLARQLESPGGIRQPEQR